MSLTKYLIRRALYLVPVFFGITFLVFSIERLAGDPVKLLTAGQTRVTEQERQLLRQYFGLDKPLYAQYFLWLSELFTGNLGYAFTTGGGAPVSTLIRSEERRVGKECRVRMGTGE